jgi:hypothetical protein
MSPSRLSRQRPRLRPSRPGLRPQVELLEQRNLLSTSTFMLTPLKQVSNGDPLTVPPADAALVSPSSEVEPQIAVDPRNPACAVAVWQQDRFTSIGGSLALVASFSTDANCPAGAHWSTPAVIPGFDATASGAAFERYTDPWVTISPCGDVYATGLGFTPRGPIALDSAVLAIKGCISGGGLSWKTCSLTTLIDNPAPPDNLNPYVGSNDKDMVIADPTNANNVYVVWDQFDFPSDTASYNSAHSFGIRANSVFARTTDGGAHWDAPQNLTSFHENAGAYFDSIVVQHNGDLVDVFSYLKGSGRQPSHADKFVVGAMRSTDHGATWSDISSGPNIDAMAVTDPDTGALVRDGDGIVSVAADPTTDGRLYAVWADGRFSGHTHEDIAFSESDDGGLTWSDPIKVNQAPTSLPAGDQQAFTPVVAVNCAGTVAVTYYDFRNNTAAAGLLTDYWLVHASSKFTDPNSWKKDEKQLTTTSFNLENAPPTDNGDFFLGDYQGLAAAGTSFYALFGQAGSGASDPSNIWFRDPPPAPALPAATAASQGVQPPGGLAGDALAGLAIGVFAGNTPGPGGTGLAPAGGRSSVVDGPPPVRGDLGPLTVPAAPSADVLRSGGGRGTDSADDALLDALFSDGRDDPLSA